MKKPRLKPSTRYALLLAFFAAIFAVSLGGDSASPAGVPVATAAISSQTTNQVESVIDSSSLTIGFTPNSGATTGLVALYANAIGETPWNSRHWENNISRNIDRQGDPYDPSGWSLKRGSGTLEVDGAGILQMSGSQPRLYLGDGEDKFWKNVEVTAYYMRAEDDDTPWGGLVIGARSGSDGHNVDTPCDATTYYARLRHDGKADFYKELKHPDGETRQSQPVWGGKPLPYDRWIGVKFVVHNMENTDSVKLALYRDLSEGANGGEWEKLFEYVDEGGWGNAEGCEYAQDYKISDGGGVVLIRNTNVDQALYKWLSVREIGPHSRKGYQD